MRFFFSVRSDLQLWGREGGGGVILFSLLLLRSIQACYAVPSFGGEWKNNAFWQSIKKGGRGGIKSVLPFPPHTPHKERQYSPPSAEDPLSQGFTPVSKVWREAKSLVADAFWGHLAFPHLFLFIIGGSIQVSHFAAVYFPWKCLSSSKRIMESWDPSSLLLYSSFCSLYLGGGGGGGVGANEVALSDLSKDSEGVNAWIALLFPVVAGDCGSMQKFFPPPPPPFLFPSPFLGIITAIIQNGTKGENYQNHPKPTLIWHFYPLKSL